MAGVGGETGDSIWDHRTSKPQDPTGQPGESYTPCKVRKQRPREGPGPRILPKVLYPH